jgi:hypothetical protein
MYRTESVAVIIVSDDEERQNGGKNVDVGAERP